MPPTGGGSNAKTDFSQTPPEQMLRRPLRLELPGYLR